MLLMVEKGIRSEICHSIVRYAKFSKKYPKENQNKTIKKSIFSNVLDKNDLYRQETSQNRFEWDVNVSDFVERRSQGKM